MMKTPFEGIPSQSVDEEELTKITYPKKSQWKVLNFVCTLPSDR